MRSVQTLILCLIFGLLSGLNTTTAQTENLSTLKNDADTLFSQNKPVEALVLYEKIIESVLNNNSPKDEIYYSSLRLKLNCIGIMRQYDKAIPFMYSIRQEMLAEAPTEVRLRYLSAGSTILIRVDSLLKAANWAFEAYSLAKETEVSKRLLIDATSEIAIILGQRLSFHDSSLVYYKEAIKLETELNGPKSPIIGTFHGRMGQVLTDKGMIREGLFKFTQAITHTVVGIDSTFLDNAPKSERYDSLETYLSYFISEVKARDILKVYPSRDLPGITNIGYTLFDRGYLNLAEDYFLTAEKEYIQRERWGGLGSIYNGLAAIYHVRKQYEYSLRLYRKSESYFQRAGYNTERDFAWLYNNMAILFNELKQIDSSSYYNAKALKMRKYLLSEPNPEIAASYLNIGMDKSVLKEFDEALKYFDKAIKNGFRDSSEVFFLKGAALKGIKKFDSALYYMKESLKHVAGINDSNQNSSYNEIGDFYRDLGIYDSALVYYNKSIISNYSKQINEVPDNLNELKFSHVVNPFPFLSSINGRESTFKLLYDSSKNIDYLKRQRNEFDIAKEVVKKMRVSFIQEIDNADFSNLVNNIIDKSLEMYRELNELEDQDTYIAEAFEMMDLGKSQIVLDAVKSRQIASSPINEVLLKWSRIKNNINREKAVLRELMLQKAPSDQSKKSQQIIDDLERSLSLILSELRINQTSLYSYLSNEISQFTADDLKDYAADHNSIFVQYFWGKKELFMVSLNDGVWKFHTLKVGLDKLSKDLDGFKAFLGNPQSVNADTFQKFSQLAYQIYQDILMPVLKGQEDKRVIIIPNGPLSNFPFDALISEKYEGTDNRFSKLPFLIKSFEINYASSAAILLEKTDQKRHNETARYSAWAPFSEANGQLVSDSEILRSEVLSGLPGASKEIEALGTFFEGTKYFDQDANEKNFKAHAGKTSIIHIATHGRVNNQAPLLSNLIFGEAIENDSSQDNKLYMFELYAMRLNTELAVLTACNTGSGVLTEGEGTMSLARAFKYAGAKSVLMSLWLANDQSTSDIVGDFYHNLAEKQTKGEALRNAKLKYLNQADNLSSHPFYWSHLILSGDSSPLSSSGNPTLWILIGLGLLILAFLMFRKSKSPVN